MFLLERIYISGFLIGLTTFAERGDRWLGRGSLLLLVDSYRIVS